MEINYKKIINGIEFLVGEINAQKCKNISRLCDELENAFQWKKINNVSCIDAMYDLSWHDEKNYLIVVNKFHTLKNEKLKTLITNELDGYVIYWELKKVKEKIKDENNFLVEYR